MLLDLLMLSLALVTHAAPASAPATDGPSLYPRTAPASVASRLYPHASETREVLDLAGEGWLLASASSDGATTAAVPEGWLREPLSLYADALGRQVRQVALPASFDSRGLNATEDMEPRVFQLERTIFVPAAWCAGDGDVTLRVGAVNHDATAFVDGRPLCTHSGEYLPFECQLPTEQLCGDNRGGAIRLALVVSNVRTWATLPPGRTVEAAGITRLDQWSGQYSFTGVHGSVHLIARPRRRISDVSTATTLEANGTATLTVVMEHEAEAAATVRATLRDARGTSVATAVGSAPSLSLNVEHPRLWWPAGTKAGPYLYSLELCLQPEGACEDVYRLKIGLRTVAVAGRSILVNGDKIFLRGVHANTDSTISGRGMLRHYAVRDAELLQHLGANLLRNTGPPEALLDACDALGIMVFDELVHGLNKNGCERSSGPSAAVFSESCAGAATLAAHKSALTGLVSRDKNRPSVIACTPP